VRSGPTAVVLPGPSVGYAGRPGGTEDCQGAAGQLHAGGSLEPIRTAEKALGR
jgi:hypothetical protein